ncbi:MAG: methylmalonyl Co-A mutase-associated GTPase MeaB [Candidatus Atabeyarchaeum deiterrae]
MKRLLDGDRRALGKLITLIDDGAPEGIEAIVKLFPKTGHAQIIGITGSPGVGKSSLINALTRQLRDRGKTVGIIAVDPSSPFSGGALLGDRIRMQDHFTDEGVFIRSLASRGSLGGLSKSVNNVIRLLDAFGRDIIIVETVGAGQVEVDIVKVAHTVIVVMSPGYGDVIQMLKAGIIEIGDIFAINKSDLEGTDRTVEGLMSVLELSQKEGWRPPIVQTVAVTNKGITELVDTIEKHRNYLQRTNLLILRERKRIETELINLVNEQVYERITKEDMGEGDNLKTIVSKVQSKQVDPYTAAKRIISALSSAK